MANDVQIDIGARNLASRVLDRVGRDVKGLGAKAKRASVAFAGSIKSMSGALGGLKIAAAAAAAGFGVAVRTFANFDKGMAQVAAVTGATGQELDALRAKAKEMGSTTQFSASQAAEAMKFLGMAGFDTNQILDGIGPTLSLAAAGALELGMAADIASDVSSAFGLAASDIGRVADVLATTATSANTTVEMLGETFTFAAPVAKAAGQSIEEVSVAAGILGNAGIKASSAGTDLKNVMVALSKEDTAQKIRDLGVEITGADGEMRSMLDIMEDFGTATANMTGPQRLATAIDIFGKISGKSALILSDAGDSVDKLRQKMGQAEGSAKRMADVMQDNLGGVGTRIMSALEGLAIEMVEGLAEPLSDMGTMLTDELAGMTEWFSQNREAMVDFGIAAKHSFEIAIAVAKDYAEVLWPITEPLKMIVDQLKQIDYQMAKVGAADLGINFMEWFKGTELAPTIGGGGDQRLLIFQQVVDGLQERLELERGITQEKKEQRKEEEKAKQNAPKFMGAEEDAIKKSNERQKQLDERQRRAAERLRDLFTKKVREYDEVFSGGSEDLTGRQSRILTSANQDRNPIVAAMENAMRKENTRLLAGFEKAAERIAQQIDDAFPEFKVLSAEFVEA